MCRLAGRAIAGGVRRVQQTHAGFAGRVFSVVWPVGADGEVGEVVWGLGKLWASY